MGLQFVTVVTHDIVSVFFFLSFNILTYLLTYLLHGAESFLRS